MQIYEIIIIVVSVLIVPLYIIYTRDKIGPGVKKISAGLYTIFALVSLILSAMEAQRLKKSFNTHTATGEEKEANFKDIMKATGLAGLAGFLLLIGIFLTGSLFFKD